MKIHLNYRDPTPVHCKVGVFINGAFTGELTLRQEDLDSFQSVILIGLNLKEDEFSASGESTHGIDRTRPILRDRLGSGCDDSDVENRPEDFS